MHNRPLAVETSHHSSSSVTVSIFGALSEILSHTTESLSFLTSTTTESSPLAHTHSTFLSTDPSHSKPISSTIQSAPKKASSITNPNTFDPFSSIDFASSEASNEATVSRTTAAVATTASPSNHRQTDGEQVHEIISETSTNPVGPLHLSSTNDDTLINRSRLNGEQIDRTKSTNHTKEKSARLLKQTAPFESTTSQNPKVQTIPSSSLDPSTSTSFAETTTVTIPVTIASETTIELTTNPSVANVNLSIESVSHAPNRSIDDSFDTPNEFHGGQVPHIIIPSTKTNKQNDTTNTNNTSKITPPLNAPKVNAQTTTTMTMTKSKEKSISTTMSTTPLETTTITKLTSSTTVVPKVSTSTLTTTATATITAAEMTTVKTKTTAPMTTVSAKIIPTLNPIIPKIVELTTTQPPSVNIFDLMSKRVTALAEPIAATESIRPIYLRPDVAATTQSTSTEAAEMATTISHTPRFLTRIPILPIGFYGTTTKTTLPPLPTSPSSMATPKMQLSTHSTTKIASTPKKARRFDFFVYGILPNKTVVRKYPDDIFGSSDDATTEDPAIIYGILSNRTVIRKFPNGTTQIDEAKSRSRAFEVTDIDVKSLFNPNSDIYVKQWSTEKAVAATPVQSPASTAAHRVGGERDGSAIASTIAPSDINNNNNNNKSNNGRDLLLHGNPGRNVVNIVSTTQATIKTYNNNSTSYFTATNSTTNTTTTNTINSATTTTTNTNSTTSLPSTYHNVNATSDSAMVFNLPHTIFIYIYSIYVYSVL